MGLTHVTVALANLQRDKVPFEAEFLVDTGAIDSWIRDEIHRRILII